MLLSVRKEDKLLNIISDSLADLPSPSSLSYFWNFGSLLGVFLGVQILSGLFLAIHFTGDVNLSFDSIIHMMRDINYGWLLRVVHANGASMFFLLMYIHIGRGLYYGSYNYSKVWLSGVSIFLLSMATAFLGYVLPWGQMSFWAATVITNLLSAIPYIGIMMVEWVWGGFAVGNPTLIRFFSFHFILPFVIMFLVILHLFFLHETGSSNMISINSNSDSIFFHPYFSFKDVFGFGVFFIFFVMICVWMPYIFMDVENFISSDPLVTPVHIQPEWYFLFAYTILRSVPSSVGGVIALIMSVMILYLFPFFFNQKFRSIKFYYINGYLFWFVMMNWLLLTWIGACVVELPYMYLGMLFSFIYFFIIVVLWMICNIQDLFIL